MMPEPKTFLLNHGEGSVSVPNAKVDRRPIAARPMQGHPGSPLEPTGNPMLAGVGPGSWAERDNVPDLTFEGLPKIVPLRVAKEFFVPSADPNPTGMRVLGADGREAGVVHDIWIDRSEPQVRYLELIVSQSNRHVLLPIVFAKVNGLVRHVSVHAILSSQFAEVPTLANPDQVTRLEEDKISAYYGGGTLYATPGRAEPLL
jgi:photosynthetic reaction center H subunit